VKKLNALEDELVDKPGRHDLDKLNERLDCLDRTVEDVVTHLHHEKFD
jgi:hypothetical protein